MDNGDLIKLIIFIVFMVIVGISKLVEKMRQSPPSSSPPSQRKQQTPRRTQQPAQPRQQRPSWQAEQADVRKFLEQLSGERREQSQQPSAPTAAPPVITQERRRPAEARRVEAAPMPAERPAKAFRQPRMPSDAEIQTHAQEYAAVIQRFASSIRRASELSSAITKPKKAEAVAVSTVSREQKRTASGIRKILSERGSLRHAFVVSEILKEPKGA